MENTIYEYHEKNGINPTHAVGFNYSNAFMMLSSELESWWNEKPDSQTSFKHGTFEECKQSMNLHNEQG